MSDTYPPTRTQSEELAGDPVARRLGFVTDEDWYAVHNHKEPTLTMGCSGCDSFREWLRIIGALEEKP